MKRPIPAMMAALYAVTGAIFLAVIAALVLGSVAGMFVRLLGIGSPEAQTSRRRW